MSDSTTAEPLLEGYAEWEAGKVLKDKPSCCDQCKKVPFWVWIILAVVILLIIGGSVAAVLLLTDVLGGFETLSPTDDLIERIGRWDMRDKKSPAFTWSGSGFRFALKGTENATIKISHDFVVDIPVRYWVNGREGNTSVAKSGEINLTFGNSTGPHLVELAKQVEAQYGVLHFDGVVVEKGAKYVDLKDFSPKKKRVIEFIGDSITCGHGVLGDSMSCTFSLDTEDATAAYAWQIAKRLNATPNIISWSGLGVTCNYNGTAPGEEMPKRYPYLFGWASEEKKKEPKWDFTSIKPDAVMMFLGTNDDGCFGLNRTQFKEDYKKFWDDILNDYYKDLPDLKIIVGCGGFGFPYEGQCIATTICSDVREAVAEANNSRVHFLPLFSTATATCCDAHILGCGAHPNTHGQEFIFESAAQKVAELLDWTDSFVKIPKRNIAASWGSSSSSDVANLARYCGTDALTDEYTMFMIDAVNQFGKGSAHSVLHIDNSFCNETFSSGLLNCSAIGNDISLCKSRKVKVLLTLGGPDGTYDLQSEDEAVAVADELWDTYFGGNSSTRPFGDVSLDGINLDIQQGTGRAFYPKLVSRLREKAANSSSSFTVAVTTKDCVLSNETKEDPLISMNSTILRVRYMDNSSNCTVASSSFESSIEDWLEYVKLFQSKTQIVVSTDCNRTHFFDLKNAVGFAQVDGERFDGIAFDSVDHNKQRTLHPRILNTLFKMRY